METTTQTVDLSNIKYAIAVEGGGWAYEHTLYLITNDGDVYITEDFKDEDIVPSKKAKADYLGKVDVSKDFVVPEKLQKCVLDAPSVMVFDSNLHKPIYNAFGCEDEFRDYFKEVMELERAFNERKREKAYAKLRKEENEVPFECNEEERAKKDENGFLLRNENAYSNGKKMTADEFFAMSSMLLDNMDVPDDMEK